MDTKAYLKAQGLSDEDIATLTGNDKYANVLSSMATEAENGKTAYLKAQEIERNLKTWNETQVTPYVQKADAATAAARAEAAAMRTHMKTLKDQGYDIPDAYLAGGDNGGGNPNPPAKETPVAGRDYTDDIVMSAKANMALISMSEKARDLLGHGLDVEAEYEDFSKNLRPGENLRSYIDRKYDLSAKDSARKAAAEQKKLDDYANTKLAEEKAKWAERNGANPETRNPQTSRFDRIISERNQTDPTAKPNWMTAAGRERAAQDRVRKYSGMTIN